MFYLNFGVMKRKLLKSIALLLFMGMSGVFCVNSVYASFWDDYEFINCPDGMAFNPEIALCEWFSGENSENDYVCLVKKKIVLVNTIVFACKPDAKTPDCRTTYEGVTLICNNAKIVINLISK